MTFKGLKLLAIGSAVVVVLLFAALHLLLAQYNENKAVDQLRSSDVEFEQHFVNYEGEVINTYSVGDPSLEKVLMIHGSPGHWTDWVNVILIEELTEKFCFVLLDRPGYGPTTVKPQRDLVQQAAVSEAVMDHYCDESECYTLVGHSYGGGVVEQLLLQSPRRVSAAVYVAGTLSPKLQQPRWYNYAASTLSWALPREVVSSNIEMMGLQNSLMANAGQQRRIRQPIVLIHGTADVLVPRETVDYYKRVKPDGVRYVIREKMNHFIPWTDPDIVANALLSLESAN